ANVHFVALGTMAGVFILLVLLFPEESLRSFESDGYENMLIALFLALSMLVTGTFVRFALSWRSLRSLLVALNSLVIARFFGRLPDFEGTGPVWIRDFKLMSLATSVNSAIALHNLKLAVPLPQLDPEDYWKALQDFLSPEPRRDRRRILWQYRLFLEKAAHISRNLSEKVLVPFWLTHRI